MIFVAAPSYVANADRGSVRRCSYKIRNMAALSLPFVSEGKPLRGCVTGRNFLQVSLLSYVGAASHAAREGAVRRRPYTKRMGR